MGSAPRARFPAPQRTRTSGETNGKTGTHLLQIFGNDPNQEVIIMPFYISAAILSSQLTVTIADRVPNLDFMPGCQQAVTVTTGSLKGCIRDERNARKVLTRSWARFAPQDQMRCTEETNLDGTPSYVELLTCLQIAADARKLPARAKQ